MSLALRKEIMQGMVKHPSRTALISGQERWQSSSGMTSTSSHTHTQTASQLAQELEVICMLLASRLWDAKTLHCLTTKPHCFSSIDNL